MLRLDSSPEGLVERWAMLATRWEERSQEAGVNVGVVALIPAARSPVALCASRVHHPLPQRVDGVHALDQRSIQRESL